MRLSVRRFPPCVLLLALVLAACHDSTGPISNQATARLRWAEHGPASYRLTVTRSCFCPSEVLGPVDIVVANGDVQSRTYVQTGEPVQPMFVDDFPTVEGLFEYIESVRESGTPVEARYDATFGYPVRIVAGNNPAADDGEIIRVELSGR
jgi:hypothetical protein